MLNGRVSQLGEMLGYYGGHTMAEERTYTQAEVEEQRREASEIAFRKGQEKAKESANQKTQAEKLKYYEEKEAKELAEKEFNSITTSLQSEDLAEAGLKKSAITRFAKEHMDDLKGLEGKELSAKVKELRESANEDDRDLFFGTTEVSASGSLKPLGSGATKPGYSYVPGTTIRIKN